MKICFIVNSIEENSGGGWGRYAIDLIKEVREAGSEVVILTSRFSKINDNFSGVNYRILPNHKQIIKGLFWLVFNIGKLKNIIKDCDCVHCLVEPYAPLTLFLSGTKPYFLTLHGTFAITHLKILKVKFFFKLALKKAKKVICVSHFTLDMVEREINLNNIVVINNGVNFQKFSKIKSAEEGAKIISVGMLKWRKGYHLSIPAVALVKQKFPDVVYNIIGDQGDGYYFLELKRLVERYKLEKNVFFLHNLTDDELIAYYGSSGLFLLTPVAVVNNFEGFGLVYLEAGACGLPVVGTKNSGSEDAVINGETGLLVEPKIEDIAEAIIKILTNKNLSIKLSENGVKRAAMMDWKNISEHYMKIYELYNKNN